MNNATLSIEHYDLIVIGSGAARHRGAIQSRQNRQNGPGRRTELRSRWSLHQHRNNPEQDTWQAVMRLSRFGTRTQDGPVHTAAQQLAIAQELARRIEQVAGNEVSVYENQFRRNGVEVLKGKASFADRKVIRVDGANSSGVSRGASSHSYRNPPCAQRCHSGGRPFDCGYRCDRVEASDSAQGVDDRRRRRDRY